jgi:hypothetical protein
MIVKALKMLRPGAAWELEGDTYSGLLWKDDINTIPTEQEVLNAVEYLRLHDKEMNYAEYRRENYPTMGDQLDALFHAGIFPEEMRARIQVVKDTYPKPIDTNFSISN